MKKILLAIAFALSTFPGGHLFAQGTADPAQEDASEARQQAEACNNEGKKLIRQLDLQGAAEQFRLAMKLVPDPRYAFNLCYTLEKSRKFAEARFACEAVASSDDPRLIEKATELLAAIEEQLAARAATEPEATSTAVPATTTPPTLEGSASTSQPTNSPGLAGPGGPSAQSTSWQTSAPATQPAVIYQPYPALPIKRTESYRTHVLIADAASWTILAIGSGSGSDKLLALGTGGLLLGGAAVHIGHGNTRSAWLSFGVRAGLPIAGAYAFSSSCSGQNFDCLGQAIAGGVLGYGLAVTLDWFVFAKKTEYVYPVAGALALRPTLEFKQGGAVAGLSLEL